MKSADKKSQLIALHRLEIASPCTASWAAMQGNEQVRHCGDCNKNVFNLSAMGEAEAAALLADNGGDLCVRFYRRADGTVMTSDCGTSVRASTRRALRQLPAAAGIALLAMSAGAGAAPQTAPPLPPKAQTVEPVMMMGAPPPPPAAQEVVEEKKQPAPSLVMGKPSFPPMEPIKKP